MKILPITNDFFRAAKSSTTQTKYKPNFQGRMVDLRRIKREIQLCQDWKGDGVRVEVQDDSDLTNLTGVILGPTATPYEGGIFKLSISLPETYPFHPPKVTFISRVYHPNISSKTGCICLDILKDAWTPVYTLKTTLISIQSLLFDAVPDDPQDAEVARHYKSDRKGFNETAGIILSHFKHSGLGFMREQNLIKRKWRIQPLEGW